MDFVVRLQNVPLEADCDDIREYFAGLSISVRGIEILGGKTGDCFLFFTTHEDVQKAIEKDGGAEIKDSIIKIKLSSKYEMIYVKNQKLYQKSPSAVKSNGYGSPVEAFDERVNIAITKPDVFDLGNVRRRLALLSFEDRGQKRKRTRSESPPRKFARTDSKESWLSLNSSDETSVNLGNDILCLDNNQGTAMHDLRRERLLPRLRLPCLTYMKHLQEVSKPYGRVGYSSGRPDADACRRYGHRKFELAAEKTTPSNRECVDNTNSPKRNKQESVVDISRTPHFRDDRLSSYATKNRSHRPQAGARGKALIVRGRQYSNCNESSGVRRTLFPEDDFQTRG